MNGKSAPAETVVVDDQDNAERIMRAASKILLAKGLAGLSVRAIATEAGLSTIGIYTHFHGKQGILDALFVTGFTRVRTAMEAAYAMDDPKQAMQKAVSGYISVATSHPAQYNLIFGQADVKYIPGKSATKARQEAFQALVRLVSRWLPAEATEKTRHRTALRFWAAMHGYVSLLHNGPADASIFDDFEEQVTETMFVLLAGTKMEHDRAYP